MAFEVFRMFLEFAQVVNRKEKIYLDRIPHELQCFQS
jgi:hypothetical protein